MVVGLFIPCYIDQFYPGIAISTLALLEKFECKVVFPIEQTCCGQPMANAGFEHLSGDCNENFVDNFSGFDYIVCPSGSCTLHVKDHLHSKKNETAAQKIRTNVYELTEFLTDVLQVKQIDASFKHRVTIHHSCHGLRGLNLSQMSEKVASPFSKPLRLLQMVKGIEILNLERPDECCGFGGTFCVSEEAVSVKMGKDLIADHLRQETEVITGVDMSCLIHMEGLLRRDKSPIRVMHIAEILNSQ